MLNEFWQAKKHLLQIEGALITIGTLFLTIPESKNEIAQKALLNIQFFWLVIIAISIIIFLTQLTAFLFNIEQVLRSKRGVDFGSALSVGFVAFALFFYFIL